MTVAAATANKDVDTGEGHFATTVVAGSGNLGSLELAVSGGCRHTVAQCAVSSVVCSSDNGGTSTHVDTFTVSAADGTSKLVSFTIHGANDAAVIGDPTVAEIGRASGRERG